MEKKNAFRRMTASEWLCLGILLATIVLSAVTVFSVSQKVLDGDASAELVLAHHLSSEGRILSQDWYYSTEIRAFYTQLVFAPLFSVFEDWSTVRFVGTMILQMILLASYGYLVHTAGLNPKAFFLGGALLLMPVSVTYGRIVLYHVYYIINIIVNFLLAAWLLAALRDWELRKRGWLIVHLALFMALSWVSSLNGYRQIATGHMPLALLAVLWMWRAQNRQEGIRAFVMLMITCAGILFGGVGLLQNIAWQQVYSFADYSGIRLTMISSDGLMDMLFGLMHQFGFRRDIPVLTKMGLLSLLSVPVALFCLVHSARSVMERSSQLAVGERLISHMLPCSLAVVIMIFVFTTQNVDAERYFLTYSVWYIPMLAWMMTGLPSRKKQLPKGRLPEWVTAPRLVACALWAVCMFNGLCNMQSFIHPDGFNQKYEGLTLDQPDHVFYLKGVQELITDEKYDLGYCTFWDGNVITELTDGRIPTINLYQANDERGLVYRDWLTLQSTRSMNAHKPFLLLYWDQEDWIKGSLLEPLVDKAYEVDGYIVYDIPDLEAFRDALKE